MMTSVFATLSKRASPGSAKDGASVSTEKKKKKERFNHKTLLRLIKCQVWIGQ